MAPETLYGESASPRSDVYSLGSVLFELCTGSTPAQVRRDAQISLLEGLEVRLYADLPDALSATLEKAIAPRASERYPSAVELAADLRQLASTGLARQRMQSADPVRSVGNLASAETGYAAGFFGRVREAETLRRLFDAGERLVTLLGPGGTGKTRLSKHFAVGYAGQVDLTGGIWFADVSSAKDAEALAQVVASVFDLDLVGKEEPTAAVSRALAGRGPLLLVLDNLEQVIDGVRETLPIWLEQAPELRVLATSRIASRLASEKVLELAPLGVPDENETDPSKIEICEAVELFVDRARRLAYGAEIGGTDLLHVARIVREVDGLPLAVELAAARSDVLSPEQIADRLSSRFSLLKGRKVRSGGERHAALWNTLEWSWELLSPIEQQVFAECSAFYGPFDLEAVESVIHSDDALEVIQALVGYSLVRRERHGQRIRFSLFENMHAYASEKIGAARAALAERHCVFYLEKGTDHARIFRRSGAASSLEELAWLRENLLAIAQSKQGAAKNHARAALCLAPLLEVRGPHALLRRLLDSAVEVSAELDADDRVSLLFERGACRFLASELEGARADLEQARREAGSDPWLACRIDLERAVVMRELGQNDEALALFEQGIEDAETLGEQWLCAYAYGNRGMLRGRMGWDREPDYREAIRMFEAAGDRRYAAVFLNNLGTAILDRLGFEEAAEAYERALGLYRELGEERWSTHPLFNLAIVEQHRGHRERASEHLLEVLRIARSDGDRMVEGAALGRLAGIAHAEERANQAISICRRAIAIFEALGERRYRGMTLGLLAVILASAGKAEEGRDCCIRAERLIRDLGDPSLALFVTVCEARVALRNDRDESERIAFALHCCEEVKSRSAISLELREVLGALEQDLRDVGAL
jgi:predicted ATPase